MSFRRPSLRREIVLGYSAILLVALLLFAGATYAILRRTLANAGTQSLRQTAAAAERIVIPPGLPVVGVSEELLPPTEGAVEVLRRTTRLPTGELNIIVARTGDVEQHALRSFALIALVLIPVTALLAVVAGRSVADRILMPLNRLVTASREIGIGGLSRRVDEPERPQELRELAQAYNGMLERLDRAVIALRSFTADASHELRTPLTAIRGTAEVALARDRTADELRGTLEEVLDETGSMLHLVEDLLVLARGDQAHAELEETTDLAAVLRDVQDVGEALAGGKPVEVRLDAPESLRVPGDAGALRRLFLNLVFNAVKFTERGAVTITARAVPAAQAVAAADGVRVEEAGPGVEVQVADTGIGIAAEDLPRVFDRFYRADASRATGGTGLGLSIARMVAERHRGTITVESTPGAGSVFTVRLPGFVNG
ncbi:MAG TPA: ATP-binding protein [Longimicrobium sp.]|jgi:heavy metal sensor kinase|uniref:sensor histidine kinase n=1 Tax=Longimicrobium sp. TaxID=2029185 RepID=UPI002ED88E6B